MLGSSTSKRRPLRIALVVASLLATTTPALAQVTTATVRGNVSAAATPTPGATVTARNVDTGFTTTATAGSDGSYVLTGLRPGTYDINTGTRTERIIDSVGQSLTLDLDTSEAAVTEAPPAEEGDILVVGTRLAETRTSELATNVTDDQIENLPQNNRNFINFAALAPGVQVLQTEFRQTFGGAGVGTDRNGDSFGGPQVNVFIDGVSLRSNVNQGGIVGQDVSRGNPFSQLAVAEFRVLTSNFKAEYEDAGTSIITAVTRSGTNRFSGEIFGLYQDDSMIATDAIVERDNLEEPELQRWQFGAGLGGPIIRDNLFFFSSYEGNLQDRARTVVPGGPPALQAQVPFDLDQFRGSFASPFREHLGFTKFTWQPADSHLIELSGSVRIETDLRDFGGTNARERGTNVDNDVYTGRLRWDWNGNGFINEASIDYLRSDLAFGADFDAGFGQIFSGVISIGGRADFQEVEQEGLTFRNNLSLTDVEWNGRHLIKMGAKVSFQDYRVGGSGPFANPQFEFVINDRGTPDPSDDLNFDFPAVVRFGGGDPEVSASTTQIGLFLQDDWEVNEHLIFNLGLRWDVDTNARNNDFVTPARAAEALRALGADPRAPSFFDVEDYISDGDRSTDYDNIAPRIGFSYDVNADQRTVIFGGYGRYYDRTLFRSAAEEVLLSQYRQGELLFSDDGLPRDGRPTIVWNDAFLTPAGFDALLASLAADPTSPGTTELRVIPNDLRTPYTDQFSIGVRQRFGLFRTSLTYSHIIGRDQIGYAPLNRTETTNAAGFFDFIPLINGFSNAVAAFNTRATRYDAVYVTLDKPYTEASGWGFGVAYTLAWSKGRGFAFNFDVPNIGEQDYVPNAGNERHRVVANAIVDLGSGFRLSGLATYSSGLPYFIVDATGGFQPNNIRLGHFLEAPGYLQLDLRLQKSFRVFNRGEFTLSAEVFNLFNADIWAAGDDFFCCGNRPVFRSGPNVGSGNVLAGPPRSFQFGAAFRF